MTLSKWAEISRPIIEKECIRVASTPEVAAIIGVEPMRGINKRRNYFKKIIYKLIEKYDFEFPGSERYGRWSNASFEYLFSKTKDTDMDSYFKHCCDSDISRSHDIKGYFHDHEEIGERLIIENIYYEWEVDTQWL